ncbi:flavin-binding monooxygenase [Pyrenophora seminiperda CCB06]|uniref:Flavin-binding monooxygenase n=1 Tax=Pyrenophora seminiperda CCB06 TaxID=1302712 RepID=A0A3M7LXP1_9PLEO|nr:flavin-binding monooxygenase [Pyrenophora seminiperda CCB06]
MKYSGRHTWPSSSAKPKLPTSTATAVYQYAILVYLALSYVLRDSQQHMQQHSKKEKHDQCPASSTRYKGSTSTRIPTPVQNYHTTSEDEKGSGKDRRCTWRFASPKPSRTGSPAQSRTRLPTPRRDHDIHGPVNIQLANAGLAISRVQMSEAWTRMRAVSCFRTKPANVKRAQDGGKKRVKKVRWGVVQIREFDPDVDRDDEAVTGGRELWGSIQREGTHEIWGPREVGNKDHTNAAVVIIGAGISGMCMAIDLIKRNQCHNFIIVEKSSSVGGTWYDNKYPGCCCDVWSTLYSYSFEQNPDWTREYPGQEEILDYLRGVARKYNLYKYIRFNTAVDAATWDDAKKRWKVDVRVTGGKDAEFTLEYSIECDFLISAVGQLNKPYVPDIEGMQDFKGKIMHSARWDWSHSLQGENVGVIGNGATAAQIIPEILPDTSSLTVYQRSPNWLIARLDKPISPLKRAILRYVPPVRWRIRSMMMDFRESFHPAVTDSHSAFADFVRSSTSTMLQTQLPDRPDLWPKLTPDYAPGCKRVIISDDYYPSLASPKTELVDNPIARITPIGIQLQDGTHRDHSTLVLATGFRTVDFLSPMKITGTQSRSLHGDIWASTGPEALYGTTIPSVPNFGTFYGPNTNLGHNSIILMIEAQSRYLGALISAVLDARKRGDRIGIMPKVERTRKYNDDLQASLQKSSFADPACNSWYKNKDGKITQNWNGTVLEYQDLMSRVDWEDYEVLGGGGDIKVQGGGVSASKVVFGTGKKESRIGRVREETVVSNTAVVVGLVGAVGAGAAWAYRGKVARSLGLWKLK